MMSDLKTILVTGNSGYVGAVLVRKLLKAGHKVKAPNAFIYRNDMFLAGSDMCTIRNVNLIDLEDDFHDIKKLNGIILECNVVIYLAQTLNAHDYKLDYDAFISLVRISKVSGVERFIYVSDNKVYGISDDSEIDKNISPKSVMDCSKHNILFVEHLKNAASDNFAVSIINAPAACDYPSKQKLELYVDISNKRVISKHKITLYGYKKKDRTPFYSYVPSSWYGARNSNVSDFYIDGIADLCLYLSEQSLKEMQKKIWPYIISCKIFLNRFYATRRFFQILRKPYIPFIGRIKLYFFTIKRLFDVSLMMFLVHLWPEQTYRFSTRKALPNKARRYKKSDRPIIPYELIESRTNDIPKIKEANIIMRGSSFDIEKLEKLDSPIFLVSFWEPVQIKKDVTYVMGRAKSALRLGKLGLKVIHVETNNIDYNGNISPTDAGHSSSWYKQFIDDDTCKHIAILDRFYCSPKSPSQIWASPCSALPAICALSYFAEKINIYGWDFYLESSPDDMTYWQLYFNLPILKLDLGVAGPRCFLESAVINFYYGYHLSKLPNINIYGRLGQLNRHEKLIGKLERVLFND